MPTSRSTWPTCTCPGWPPAGGQALPPGRTRGAPGPRVRERRWGGDARSRAPVRPLLVAGSPEERTVELSAQGQEIAGGRQVVQDPQPGSSVVLTIDRDAPVQAQAYLRTAVEQNHARAGRCVVLRPHTGDVYAMASYPWFDPARSLRPTAALRQPGGHADTPGSRSASTRRRWRRPRWNRAPSPHRSEFEVPGTAPGRGPTSHDAEPHGTEAMTLGDIIGALRQRRGVPRRGSHREPDDGTGRLRGSSATAPDRYRVPGRSQRTDADRAMVRPHAGDRVVQRRRAVTPLQMASVYATIANGGTWVQPRLIDAIDRARRCSSR